MIQHEWMVVQREYEGFPLFLRYPLGLDYDALQALFPFRVVIEHTFSFRRFDGTPEPSYNSTLEGFDVALSSLFEEGHLGQVVLIETFGGKRAYYYYVSPSANPEVLLDKFQIHHRERSLSLEIKSDPTWWFIRKYSADLFPEL